MAVPLIGQFWTVVTTAQLPVTLLLRWLRGVDLNHRPLGYEFKGKLIQNNLQAHG